MRHSSRHLPILVGLSTLLAAASGCGKDSPTGPAAGMNQQAADDVAIHVGGSLAAGNGGAMAEILAAAETSSGSTAPAASSSSSASSRPAGLSGAAAETTFTRGGVTFVVTRAFYDALGQELPGYGPTAARMIWTSRATGSFEGPRYSGSIGHSGSLDVTGLLPTQAQLNFDGLALDTVQTQFTSLDLTRTRYFYTQSSLTLEDVLVAKQADANPWPLSGTATWAISADRLRSSDRNDVEAHFEATVVVTFDGTATPALKVNGVFRYRVNLATGEIVRV